MGKRRTFPGFLSGGEDLREKARVEEMVKGFEKFSRVTRIGETENFFVDCDKSQRLVLLYGKEVVDYPFKLGIKKDEIDSMVNLLIKGKKLLC